jgi:UDP-4-amino-4,6-dideoxy-N-acetyl-beta-L-altrosamine transaminase
VTGRKFLPYGRQSIGEDDIEEVAAVLRSDWLTTGPAVERFEGAVAEFTGARHAVAVSSGTAALHAAMYAADIRPGDEVIVPAMTFAATANAVVYCGGTPIFADVQQDSLLIDPTSVAEKITSRTRGIIAVDYAGQPCDYADLRDIANRHSLFLIADGCHALGASYQGTTVGAIADATTFSFHPVKHITTGEGGMITTNDSRMATRMRQFRNHGITSDHRDRSEKGQFFYEMADLGFNYRLSDIHCALGFSQLRKLPFWLEQRRNLARRYDEFLAASDSVTPLKTGGGRTHAYHLYVVRLKKQRDEVFRSLREQGIGANVHYLPVYLHPFYREKFNYGAALCPVAEVAYKEVLSLPMYPQMDFADVEYVVESVKAQG